jgi:phosphatidylserine/phosphatidylglycerophosphate/cardiolipin synthase-like enzyme
MTLHRFFPLLLALTACGTSNLSAPDGRDASAFRDGDLGDVTDCQVLQTLEFVNETASTAEEMKDLGVHSRAADHIELARVTAPTEPAFASLFEVDDVPYVGPVAMDQLLLIGAGRCAGTLDPVDAPEGSCASDSLLTWLNDPNTDADALKSGGVHSRAASAIVDHRNGADAAAGTADDQLFASLDDVDDVPYVGPVAMEALQAWGEGRCQYQAEVIFSPQPYHLSHITRVVEAIDAAQTSLDVAMYSFRDSSVLHALERATERGVSVRFLFHGASEDRKEPAGTRSAALEDLGIEVRWVNKIQHHKFAIVDGPRVEAGQAATATLLNGSGNWSNGAATRFDENMSVVQGDARLVLLFQREFNLLWENSREVEWNESIEHLVSAPITQADIDAAQGADAVFTSGNFRAYESSRYGATFTVNDGMHVVSDRLVELIESAETSIWVASGHLRGRRITEALIAKAAAKPDMDIRVYLDGQEYTSAWYYGQEVAEWEQCLAEADTREDCDDEGLHFGYALHDAGVDLRFKYYAYRWDYHYADQMHHKYLIVDGETVASGSYNISPNAEFDTFENVAIYDTSLYPELVQAFEANFEHIWRTGEADDAYTELMTRVLYGAGDVPLVFTPMALNWDQVTDLTHAIREVCPEVDSQEFRSNPQAHRYCDR